MKGIILAAGKGTRLYPASTPISKILLPIYDKPMVYYPLTTLISAGIDDILVIVSEDDHDRFVKVLGDGSQFGVRISYLVQYVQRGISDAFIIAEDFIGGDTVTLILADNIYYSEDFTEKLSAAILNNEGATIFTCPVPDPERFGVVEIGLDGSVISIEEKPKNPKSNQASTGLYIFDGKVSEYAKKLVPSKRGELEITDLDDLYRREGRLKAISLGDKCKWADTGTFDSLLETAMWIKAAQIEKGKLIGSPELCSFEKGLISKESLKIWVSKHKNNSYFAYLGSLCDYYFE